MPTREEPSLTHRITHDPDIMAGKPVVTGTRIPVETVLAYLAQNPSLDDLFADYPRLALEDVQACLAYANRLVQRARPRATATPLGASASHP
jgi:uncharacterized protein (DUF433 family)